MYRRAYKAAPYLICTSDPHLSDADPILETCCLQNKTSCKELCRYGLKEPLRRCGTALGVQFGRYFLRELTGRNTPLLSWTICTSALRLYWTSNPSRWSQIRNLNINVRFLLRTRDASVMLQTLGQETCWPTWKEKRDLRGRGGSNTFRIMTRRTCRGKLKLSDYKSESTQFSKNF